MIYFIHCPMTARVKIGHAANPWQRFSKIQSDSPGKLVLLGAEPGGREREAELHERFAALRSRGEWFSAGAELIAYVASLPVVERLASGRRTYAATWGDSGLTDVDLEPLVGLSRAQLHRIRNGKSDTTVSVARAIRKYTGVNLLDLAA